MELVDLEPVLMRLVVGKQSPEELPTIATEALVSGLDSPSLRELAGTRRTEYEQSRTLFLAAVEELGLTTPTSEEALWFFVRRWAQAMIDEWLTPFEASRLIWWEGWNQLGRPDSLAIFVGLASEWEDDEANRSEYEKDMLDAARALLEPGT